MGYSKYLCKCKRTTLGFCQIRYLGILKNTFRYHTKWNYAWFYCLYCFKWLNLRKTWHNFKKKWENLACFLRYLEKLHCSKIFKPSGHIHMSSSVLPTLKELCILYLQSSMSPFLHWHFLSWRCLSRFSSSSIMSEWFLFPLVVLLKKS